MSKKQTFKDDPQSKSNLASAFENKDPVRSENVTFLSTTTLQEIPMELQEQIVMEAIVSEVRDRKLLRSAWIKSADRIVERMRNVCPQWNHALATDGFRKRLHGFLDRFSKVKFCFKVLARDKFSNCVTVATLNNEVFAFRRQPQQHARIDIYDLSNLKKAKRTIQLPDVTIPFHLVTCSNANCLYILHQISDSIEIWRVLLDEPKFEVSPLIKCLAQLVSRMSVSADGSLILFQGPAPSTIKVYNADGSLQHELELANRISYLHDVISKSDGNFVLVKKNSLTEMDREGNTIREYNESSGDYVYCAIGLSDRLVAIDDGGHVRLLDSEFNSVKVKFQMEPYDGNSLQFYRVHFNEKGNTFVAFECAAFCDPGASQCLTIFSFKERRIPKKVQNRPKLK